MIVYIARHGQVVPVGDWPVGYQPLTALGEAQAHRLGERLVHLGFRGRVFASPYHRCLQTADIVCRTLGVQFWPDAGIGEEALEWIKEFQGYTQDAIREGFRCAAPDSALSWPWWSPDVESRAEVHARVQPLLDRIRSQDDDVLLVGHGATTDTAFYLLSGEDCGPHHNATLSAVQVKPELRILLANDFSHLSSGQVTNNLQVIA